MFVGVGEAAYGSVGLTLVLTVFPAHLRVAIAYCLGSFASLAVALHLPPGQLHLLLIGVGMFLPAATVGPSGAMVADLTPLSIYAAAMAVRSLANNLLGLAAGMIADRIGPHAALRLIPSAAVGAAPPFTIGKRHYPGDLLEAASPRNEG